MKYIFKVVKENVYVLAVWDSSWNSFNNCYFIVEQQAVIVIDSGKQQHAEYIEQALHSIGKSVEDVVLFLATHAHEDHVQASFIFKNAKKFIHPNEKEAIQYLEQEQLFYELPNQGNLGDFDCNLVGYHSPGSVIFYHRPTKILFTGDFLCFFGDPISPEGVVSEGKELRQEWLKYLQNGGVSKNHLGQFLGGLETMYQYDTRVMCTGHGGVLVGDIRDFIADLLKVGNEIANI